MKNSVLMALMLAAFATGCGSSAVKTVTRTVTTRTTSSIPAPPKQPATVDRALARGGLLRLTDFPAGWSAEDAGSDDQPRVGEACRATNQIRSAARANSPRFKLDDDASRVDQSVIVYASEPDAATALARATTADVRRCLRDAVVDTVRRQLGNGTDSSVRGGPTSELSVAPFGDESSGARIEFTGTEYGIDSTYYIDIVVARVGRAIAAFWLPSSTAPFDVKLREDLVSRTVTRLRSASAGD